jgi:hypothetical protein
MKNQQKTLLPLEQSKYKALHTKFQRNRFSYVDPGEQVKASKFLHM